MGKKGGGKGQFRGKGAEKDKKGQKDKISAIEKKAEHDKICSFITPIGKQSASFWLQESCIIDEHELVFCVR